MQKTNVIWRKSFSINGSTITLPVGAVIVRVGMKGDTPFVWFMFDMANVDKTWEPRTLIVVNTGNTFGDAKYISTLGKRDTNQLWHVLEAVTASTVGSCGNGSCSCDTATPAPKKSAPAPAVPMSKQVLGYKVCSVKGCNGKVHAGGMCRKHYDAKRRAW